MGCGASKKQNTLTPQPKDTNSTNTSQLKQDEDSRIHEKTAAPLTDRSTTTVKGSNTGKPLRVLVLHVSPLGENSNTNKIINKFLETYRQSHPSDTLVERDISSGQSVKPYTQHRVRAKFATWAGDEDAVAEEDKEEWEYTKNLAKEFASFDRVVIGNPVWNFSISNQLKKYFDHVIQPLISFDPQTYSGKLGHMSVLLVCSAGMENFFGGEKDYNLPLMKTMLSMMGIGDIKTIEFTGAANFKEVPAKLEGKYKEAQEIANTWVHDSSAIPFSGLKKIIPESIEKVPNGKKVLHIVSSPMEGDSASRTVANRFLEEYKSKIEGAEVTTLDLTTNQLSCFNAFSVQAKFASFLDHEVRGKAKEEWDYTLELIREFKRYDTYVFSVPLWNWGIPHHLKLYLDHIMQPFETFDPQSYSGILHNKKAIVISSAGVPLLGSEKDFSSPYLSTVLNHMGIKDVNHIFINGTSEETAKRELIEESTKSALELLA